MPRRGRAEGSIAQRHDHRTCPPPVDGERPEHKCRGRWVATIDLGVVGGKRKRKSIYASTRKEAAIKLQRALAQKDAGTLVTGRVTTETWLRYWLDVVCPERGLKPNTLRSHRSKVEGYLIPHLGRIPLDQLEVSDLRRLYADMRSRGLAENTISQTHAILRRALVVAVRERKATHNVADDLERPKQVKVKRDSLTLDQAVKILRAAGDNPRWWLALLYALRQGEVLALRWSDVDLVEGVLRVERSLTVKPGGEKVFVTPKSKSSTRVLPLLPAVQSRLTVLRAQRDDAPDALIFGHGQEPAQPKADWKAWKALLAAAGAPDVPLHAARNTAASLLRHFGASDRDVADILGHATVEITRHYQADDLERKRQALAALEAGLEID